MTEDCLLTSPLEYTNEEYAIAKIAGLKMCESYNLQYGTNYIAVMPTNLYGPNDNFHLENSHVMPAMMRKVYLAKMLCEGDWKAIRSDMARRPVEGVDGSATEEEIRTILAKYGIEPGKVTLWGTGSPLREFLWSEDMADASVHILLNVDFKDVIGIEKYSSVHYGAQALGESGCNAGRGCNAGIDRNSTSGRGGAIPSLGEIRNCHINVGTGKEITIRRLSELVAEAVGFSGTIVFDSAKPDGTMRKLIDVTKLHSLGWTHKVEIEEGVKKLFEWYVRSEN